MLQCGPRHWSTQGELWNTEDAACKSVAHPLHVPEEKHFKSDQHYEILLTKPAE